MGSQGFNFCVDSQSHYPINYHPLSFLFFLFPPQCR
jgi:hypothetical protein